MDSKGSKMLGGMSELTISAKDQSLGLYGQAHLFVEKRSRGNVCDDGTQGGDHAGEQRLAAAPSHRDADFVATRMVAVVELVVVGVEDAVFYGKRRAFVARKGLSFEGNLDSIFSKPMRARYFEIGVFVQAPVHEFLHQRFESENGLFCRFIVYVWTIEQFLGICADVPEVLLLNPKATLACLGLGHLFTIP